MLLLDELRGSAWHELAAAFGDASPSKEGAGVVVMRSTEPKNQGELPDSVRVRGSTARTSACGTARGVYLPPPGCTRALSG